jgi:predicted MFS family arabinose efflux permease
MADRYGRKTQLIVSLSVNALANVVLGVLILQGGVHPWHVYATGLVASTVQVFQQPARQALVPESVDRAHLTAAIGLNSIAFNMSRTLGPSIAGILIALLGPGGSYIIQGAIFLLSTVWTAMLRLPNHLPSNIGRARSGETFFESMRDGWRYVAQNATMRSGLVVSMVISFFGFSANSLLPVFADDVLKAGSSGLGILLSAMGIGAVASAFLVASAGDQLRRGMLMVGGVALYGVAAACFAASHWLLLSIGLMFIMGICNVASNTLIQTVLQSESAPGMRGRVMGVYQQHQLLIAVGGLAAGALAQTWGAQVTMGLFGAACAAGAIAVLITVPHLRSIR